VNLEEQAKKLARKEGDVENSLPPISSGSFRLNAELGGGYTRGQVTTIYYEDHTDPWPLLMIAMKEAALERMRVGIISVIPPDQQRWKNAGIDISQIMVAEASDIEEVEGALEAARRERFDLVVVDTLNAVDTGEKGLVNWIAHQSLTYRMRSALRLPDAAVIIMRIPPQKYRGGAPRYAREDENAIVVTRTKDIKTKLHIVSKGTHLPRAALTIKADPNRIDYEREIAQELGVRVSEIREVMRRRAVRSIKELKG